MQTRPSLDIDEKGGSLIPEGEYDFLVTKAEDCHSKKGNEQIKLTIKVADPTTGRLVFLFVYLVSTEAMEWKTRHFCKSAGIEEVYKTGNLTSLDCLRTKGRCSVTQKDNGKYGVQNEVQDYLFDDGDGTPTPEAVVSALVEDDIPF